MPECISPLEVQIIALIKKACIVLLMPVVRYLRAYHPVLLSDSGSEEVCYSPITVSPLLISLILSRDGTVITFNIFLPIQTEERKKTQIKNKEGAFQFLC